MKPGKIRPLAICVFRRDDRMLVSEGYDSAKQETFYRPLGGSIEFGEYGQDTVVREIQEEIGAEVTDLRYLGTLENIFTYNGQPGHEIVLVYEGAFVDEVFYKREAIEWRVDDANYGNLRVIWKPLVWFQSGQAPLYPAGLLELLSNP